MSSIGDEAGKCVICGESAGKLVPVPPGSGFGPLKDEGEISLYWPEAGESLPRAWPDEVPLCRECLGVVEEKTMEGLGDAQFLKGSQQFPRRWRLQEKLNELKNLVEGTEIQVVCVASLAPEKDEPETVPSLGFIHLNPRFGYAQARLIQPIAEFVHVYLEDRAITVDDIVGFLGVFLEVGMTAQDFRTALRRFRDQLEPPPEPAIDPRLVN